MICVASTCAPTNKGIITSVWSGQIELRTVRLLVSSVVLVVAYFSASNDPRVDLRATNPRLILMLERAELHDVLSQLRWKPERLIGLQISIESGVYLTCSASQDTGHPTFAVSSNFVMVLPNGIPALSGLIGRIVDQGSWLAGTWLVQYPLVE